MTIANPLSEHIKKLISRDGPITFASFMNLALYHEKWGYYSRQARLGKQGDFYTGPHVGPVFGSMLARQLEEMWRVTGCPRHWKLVELGPGEGLLARDVLTALREEFRDFFNVIEYICIETSDSLAQKQRDLLARSYAENIPVTWRKELAEITPRPFTGCIFSNEFVDALPVHLVKQTPQGISELYVTLKNGQLTFCEGPPSSPEMEAYFSRQKITLSPGQRAEVNLAALDWLKNAAESIEQGFVITIDYGARAPELYSPGRHDGTLRCFEKHTMKMSPLKGIGKRDITASVNFTALENQGEAMGMKSLGVISQSRFFVNLGIFDQLRPKKEYSFDRNHMKQAMAVKQLVLPEGMGNVFKVLTQAKGFIELPRLSGMRAGRGI